MATEIQRRLFAYTMKRSAVLVRFDGVTASVAKALKDVLPRRPYDAELADMENADRATQRGLDPYAFGDRASYGHRRFENESLVRLTGLVARLTELGLRYFGGSWYIKEPKADKPRGVDCFNLVFSTSADGNNQLPAVAEEALERLYFKWTHVFVNPRFDDEDKVTGRLDVIQLSYGRLRDEQPARVLTIPQNKPHTWALEGESAELLSPPQPKTGTRKKDADSQPASGSVGVPIGELLGEDAFANL